VQERTGGNSGLCDVGGLCWRQRWVTEHWTVRPKKIRPPKSQEGTRRWLVKKGKRPASWGMGERQKKRGQGGRLGPPGGNKNLRTPVRKHKKPGKNSTRFSKKRNTTKEGFGMYKTGRKLTHGPLTVRDRAPKKAEQSRCPCWFGSQRRGGNARLRGGGYGLESN